MCVTVSPRTAASSASTWAAQVRARIDDRDLPAADDVAAGAGEGVGAGIVGDDPAHERAHREAGAGADGEVEIEAEVV